MQKRRLDGWKPNETVLESRDKERRKRRDEERKKGGEQKRHSGVQKRRHEEPNRRGAESKKRDDALNKQRALQRMPADRLKKIVNGECASSRKPSALD